MTEVTCDNYDKLWKSKGGSLKNEWLGCTQDNPIRKYDPSKVIPTCCEEIMQCKNPNEWFQKNNINSTCIIHKKPDQPHFGTVQKQQYDLSKKMMIGVY